MVVGRLEKQNHWVGHRVSDRVTLQVIRLFSYTGNRNTTKLWKPAVWGGLAVCHCQRWSGLFSPDFGIALRSRLLHWEQVGTVKTALGALTTLLSPLLNLNFSKKIIDYKPKFSGFGPFKGSARARPVKKRGAIVTVAPGSTAIVSLQHFCRPSRRGWKQHVRNHRGKLLRRALGVSVKASRRLATELGPRHGFKKTWES